MPFMSCWTTPGPNRELRLHILWDMSRGYATEGDQPESDITLLQRQAACAIT